MREDFKSTCETMMNTTRRLLVIVLCSIHTHTAIGQVPEKPVYYFNPQWSPDGASIVFESTREGKSSIYVIAPDGTGLKRITDTTFDYGQPAWSPDGRHLVYYGGNKPMQLFRNSRQGGQQKQLPTKGYDAYQPVWSLQNKIAFDLRALTQTPSDIAKINADGTGFIKLTTDEKYDCAAPQWSPDGKTILFQRSIALRKPWKEITKEEMMQKRKSAEIMLMKSDGSDARVLLSHLEGEVAPFWSDDGKAIYFVSKQDTLPALFTIQIGKPQPTLVLTLSGRVYSASISPDGKYVTYAAERKKKHAVYVQDIQSKTERKLIGD